MMRVQPHDSRANGMATAVLHRRDEEEPGALDLAIRECRRAEEMNRSLPLLEQCLRRVPLATGLPRRLYVDSSLVYQGTTIPRNGGRPA